MDLLKYLVPMKNTPERFSNLAFWRSVRKLRDEVINAFEYINSWGTHIESLLSGGGGNYVKSSVISLTPQVEYYTQDLSVRILTLETDPDGNKEIYPILSITGDSFKINLSTEKTSVLLGKHIDAIIIEYLTAANKLVQFEMPTPIFKDVVFGDIVNGCSIPQCSVLSCRFTVKPNEVFNYENMRINNVNIYYH